MIRSAIVAKHDGFWIELDARPARRVEVQALASDVFRARVAHDDASREVEVRLLQGPPRPLALVDGRIVPLLLHGPEVYWLSRGTRHQVEKARTAVGRSGAHGGRRAHHGTITAPMPGRVVHIHAEVGDHVDAGAALIVIEAMKMQNALFSPSAGRVARVLVSVGDAIERGAALIEITPDADDGPEPAATSPRTP